MVNARSTPHPSRDLELSPLRQQTPPDEDADDQHGATQSGRRWLGCCRSALGSEAACPEVDCLGCYGRSPPSVVAYWFIELSIRSRGEVETDREYPIG